MKKSIIIFAIFLFILFFTTPSIPVYSQTLIASHPYGPEISDLKKKDDILQSINQINKIRASLSVVNININSSAEDLKKINDNLERYIEHLRTIRNDLVRHSDIYKDSISDVFFSEQVIAISDCYIISIKHQQLLIKELQNNPADAAKLVYSTYMAPIYYYITQGDQLIAYTETFIVIS